MAASGIEFLLAAINEQRGNDLKEKKLITDTVLMVRPAKFGYNDETANNNAFQINDTTREPEEIEEAALEEFDRLVDTLREGGVEVIVVDDSPTPRKPDAVFPNNWMTTHEDGTLVTYPMYSKVRRAERRPEVLKTLVDQFKVKNHWELETYEADEQFLEGTGSMVLDRPNKIAYACRSVRTEEAVLDDFCKKAGYRKVLFSAVDIEGHPIYHTNVMMALGNTFAILAVDTLRDEEEKAAVLRTLEETEKTLIPITLEQMMAFAGNMLQVQNKNGKTWLVMSEQAYNSLDPDQITQIQQHTDILFSDIASIETYGGGSVRCMMAEVFLEPKSARS